ncbi:MAG: nucleoside hydrolase [Spirochaetales bacterium]|nr:nucleoside hydrolase [Spirochaetales bacterium]
MAENIYIDTDCGVDDAVAIMLALSSPEVSLKGVGCVAGNTCLDNVVNNVCGLLAFYDRQDIPVYRGCSTSLTRIKHDSSGIHGENGFGNVVLDKKGKDVESQNAAEGLYLTAKANPGLKLVTLGPLTNIAVAFNLYPELNELVSEIIMMGAAIGRGNVTPFAEFNFFFDPEAAAFCLGTGLPVKILTWDATVAGMMPEADFFDLGLSGVPAGDLFYKMQEVYVDFNERQRGSRVCGFPDPLTAACLIDSAVAVEKEEMYLKIILDHNDERRGASVRVNNPEEADGEAQVIMKCDLNRFSILLKRIREKSPKTGDIRMMNE